MSDDMIVLHQQHMARKEIYLLVLGVAGLAQGMFFTYTVSVISTIEKRFKLTSKQIGKFTLEYTAGILALLLRYRVHFTLKLLESQLDHLGKMSNIIQVSCVVQLRMRIQSSRGYVQNRGHKSYSEFF